MKKSIFLWILLFIPGIILTAIYAEEYDTEFIPFESHPADRANYERVMLMDPNTGRIPNDIRAEELEFASQIPSRNSLPKEYDRRLGINWVRRGPSNIGGRTRALAIDVNNENIILAGAVSGGMWRSIDGGQSWTKTTEPDQLHSVSCIVQDTRPGKTHIWYYGTGELSYNSADGGKEQMKSHYTGDGIFRSVDNGASWKLMPSTCDGDPETLFKFDYIFNLAIDPTDSNDNLYAAVPGGLYRWNSSDDSWEKALGAKLNPYLQDKTAQYTDIAIDKNGVKYYAAGESAMYGQGFTGGGIYRSLDGENWNRINSLGVLDSTVRINIEICDSDPNILYILASLALNRGHLLYKYNYISGDGSGSGGQWEDRSKNLPSRGKFDSFITWALTLETRPDDSDVVFIGGSSLFRSDNGFKSPYETYHIGGYDPDYKSGGDLTVEYWRAMTYPNNWPDHHAMVFLPSDPNTCFSGCDGGVFKTTDNLAEEVVWESLNNGYYSTQFYTLAINQSVPGDETILGGMQDRCTFGSSDATSTDWNWITGGDGAYCAVPDNNQYILTSSQGGNIMKVSMNDKFEPVKYDKLKPDHVLCDFVAPFALDPNDNKVMYMAGMMNLLRNPDISKYGANEEWEKFFSANTDNINNRISAFAITKEPANRLYYAVSDIIYGADTKLMRIDDASDVHAFSKDITPPNFPKGFIQCIATDPANGDNVVVVFSNYGIPSVFFSHDGGTYWKNISGNLEESPDGYGSGPSCRWAEFLNTDDGLVLYLGTSVGLFSTSKIDGENTQWAQEGANSIGNLVVSMIRIRQADGFIAVATHGGGVFTGQRPLSVNENKYLPGVAFLENCKPNPVSGAASFRFYAPGAADVVITLYDVHGKVLKNLAKGNFPQGFHNIEFNVAELSAGAYFYRMGCGKHIETKMIRVVR